MVYIKCLKNHHNQVENADTNSSCNNNRLEFLCSIDNSEAVQIVEEYADCMMRIVNAIASDKRGDSKVTAIKKYLRSTINATLKQFTVKNAENVGITMKSRFTFMDIYEAIEKF